MQKPAAPLPDWELVLSAAARLQRIVPHTVLADGATTTLHARHRLSHDADHVLTDRRQRFDVVLAELESVAGWQTNRIHRPVQILGSLDGIETGICPLIRAEPLATTTVNGPGGRVTIPTKGETLRIKAVLILRRNATRDYIDFAALAALIGDAATAAALQPFDRLYPQANGQSPLQQLTSQLANPLPYDLEQTHLAEYKNLIPQWRDWRAVQAACSRAAMVIFDGVCGAGAG